MELHEHIAGNDELQHKVASSEKYDTHCKKWFNL